MNFNQIRIAVTSRLTKANLIWAGIAWVLVYFIDMFQTYEREIRLIGISSSRYFGVNISSQLGFLDVLKSANYSYAVMYSFCIFGLPILVTIWLVKYCIVEETHLGWKRVSLVLPVLLALYLTLLCGQDLVGTIILATDFFMLGLVLSGSVRWIFKGFESK